MRNFSFFVGVFCLISMSVFAQDKAKSIWPSGLIVEAFFMPCMILPGIAPIYVRL